MKRQCSQAIILFLVSLVLAACGTEPGSTPIKTLTSAPTTAPVSTVTPTPDPCAPENMPIEIEKIHKLMREFDDTALLASNTPLEQLNPTIANLQRIRREAEDLQVPTCLLTLKQYQLAHMNTVINTMLGFLSNAETEVLNQGIALARQQHDQYTLELANLLGLTVVAAPAGPFITNPGPTNVNLRALPALNAESLGILDIGASTAVLGRTADSLWYQVEFPDQPGQTAWVYASLVQLSDQTTELPVVAPTP